jgi:flagella basal body P-ring formation protein FlgA
MFQETRKFVGKLTRGASNGGFTTFFAGAMLLSGAAMAESPDWQPLEDIARTAEQYLIENRIGRNSERTTVKAGALDARLKLPRCDSALRGEIRSGARTTARMTVAVRCEGARRWKVYVPVQVIETAKVFVASRALPRGHVLAAEDIVAQKRDVSRLRSAYVTDASFLVGQRLKSSVLTGAIVTASMLAVDNYIRRGQTVTLVATNNGIRISMAGKALADGALNQRIRVENLNSGRVIEGVVRSREHVEILSAAPASFFHAEPKVSPRVADTRFSQQ